MWSAETARRVVSTNQGEVRGFKVNLWLSSWKTVVVDVTQRGPSFS